MGKRLFAEIPMYAFSPEEYQTRCEKSKSKRNSNWRYNQLVGMVCLYIGDDHSIRIGLFSTNIRRKYTIRSEGCLPFYDRATDSSRKLYVFEHDTNESIKKNIISRIEDAKNLEQMKQYYIDYEAFMNIAKAVDFKKLLDIE